MTRPQTRRHSRLWPVNNDVRRSWQLVGDRLVVFQHVVRGSCARVFRLQVEVGQQNLPKALSFGGILHGSRAYTVSLKTVGFVRPKASLTISQELDHLIDRYDALTQRSGGYSGIARRLTEARLPIVAPLVNDAQVFQEHRTNHEKLSGARILRPRLDG